MLLVSWEDSDVTLWAGVNDIFSCAGISCMKQSQCPVHKQMLFFLKSQWNVFILTELACEFVV